MDQDPDLVFVEDYDLLGENYYWRTKDRWGITEQELIAAGQPDQRVRVHPEIIPPLQKVERVLEPHGYRLYISEGYRSVQLYQLIYQKRVERYGQEQADRLINMESMPHATGKTVDALLWNIQSKQQERLHDPKDGIDSLFINFYQSNTDEQSQNYQRLQELLISTMLNNGFQLGPRQEYFHFNYAPK